MDPAIGGGKPTIHGGVAGKQSYLSPTPDLGDRRVEVLSLLEILVLSARPPSLRPRKMMIEAMCLEELCNLLGAARIRDPVGLEFTLELLANPSGVSEEEFAPFAIIEHSVPLDLGGGDSPGLYDPV